MNKADEVIKRLQEENRTFTIKILGDEKNKIDGFYIMINVQQIFCGKNDTFYGIKQKTIDLLNEAEIKFKVINE